MRLSILILALACAIASPAIAADEIPASAASSAAPATTLAPAAARPADAIDSVVLVDGEVVRGVVLSADATSVKVRLRSGEEQIIPASKVRDVNFWAPPAAVAVDAGKLGASASSIPGGHVYLRRMRCSRGSRLRARQSEAGRAVVDGDDGTAIAIVGVSCSPLVTPGA